MKRIKPFYIQNRFFYACLAIMVLFVLSFLEPRLFNLVKLLLLGLFALTILDTILLFVAKKGIKGTRKLPEKFSNGDQNPIGISVENFYTFPVYIQIIDEIPIQFQVRDFKIDRKLDASSLTELEYELRPTERGEYQFGKLNIYVSSVFGLISRRFWFDDDVMIPTYPSFIQLRKYNLLAISNNLLQYGIKKVRKLGHTMEFEQIKDYVLGDDLRTINWKATAKKNQLMVNQFQDEKSQPVYSVIDKGRVMKMPFDGLTLLDYAINASLVISNVALKKQDKAGIFAFSKKVENRVVAERRTSQMNLILEALYNVNTDFYESDFGRLYADVKRNITQRSLVLLYTNFETLDGLHRQLPYLKGIAKSHLLVVIFFKNTELDGLISDKAETVQQAYDKVIAEKFAFEKRLIVNELKKYGIYSILTTPENLTIDTINKYLEIKARGLL
ncbi:MULTISPECIES: DUF58 domain-containing protein [unclassified Algibacter]|uniref:DUF58 domain-containing protein n=1 Tax=unclassified Algibacter TaxID=2615009 RepID=UPI001E5E1FDF|nr:MULTISPECIES: DUF58 domain-containing protein [unclassified Algibacter]MCL5129723.1 DUF58 domain-containing protein [Algibacter sp. L4_22]